MNINITWLTLYHSDKLQGDENDKSKKNSTASTRRDVHDSSGRLDVVIENRSRYIRPRKLQKERKILAHRMDWHLQSRREKQNLSDFRNAEIEQHPICARRNSQSSLERSSCLSGIDHSDDRRTTSQKLYQDSENRVETQETRVETVTCQRVTSLVFLAIRYENRMIYNQFQLLLPYRGHSGMHRYVFLEDDDSTKTLLLPVNGYDDFGVLSDF